MTDTPDKNAGTFMVEIFKLANSLKEKLGLNPRNTDEGFIDPKALDEADELIAELCKECPVTLTGHLNNIATYWGEMKELAASFEREELAQKIFTLAHEISDVGSMCGHDLAAYLGGSLRDYIERTELSLEAQRVIIQAHIDALQVVVKQDMRNAHTAQAEELKKMVRTAIEKYS